MMRPARVPPAARRRPAQRMWHGAAGAGRAVQLDEFSEVRCRRGTPSRSRTRRRRCGRSRRRDRVRMRELPRELDLALEARQRELTVGLIGANQLHRARPTQKTMLGQVHLPHSAFTETAAERCTDSPATSTCWPSSSMRYEP